MKILYSILFLSFSAIAIAIATEPPTYSENTFNWDFTIESIRLSAIVIAAAALLFNLLQHFKSNKLKRVEIVSDILWRLKDDKELRTTYYNLEHGNFKYIPKNFYNSEEEKMLDKLLTLLNMVAIQYYSHNLKKSDINPITYDYLTIFNNSEVQEYLEHSELNFEYNNIKETPFTKLIKLGNTLNNEQNNTKP